MASSGSPLGIGLSIDFSKLDADLSKVADRIEKVGSTTSLKVGTLAGMTAKTDVGADQIASQVSQVGMALSQGMASGIRTSSAALLSFAARINAVIDQMSSAMITMFNRLDVAMKGHRWTNLLTGLSVSLGNFAGGGKALSPLDKAMSGAFGAIAMKASAVFNTMFENMGTKIAASMNKATESMNQSMMRVANEMKAAIKGSLDSIDAAIRRLSTTMSTTMLFAIESIAHKMKDLRVSAEATAAGIKGTGAPRPYMREPTPPKRANPIIDVEARIKPPSQAAIDRLAKSVDMSVFTKQELFAKPKPPKMDFAGAMPKPQMFQAFKSIISDAVAGIKNIPVAFKAAEASGNRAAVAAGFVADALLKIDRVAATAFTVVIRLGSGLAAMGLAGAAAIGKTISFFQTLGSIGKKSFADLYQGHGVFMGSVLGGIKVLHMLYSGLKDIVTLRAFRRVGDDATQAKGAVGALTGATGRLLGSIGRLGVELAAAFGMIGLVYKVVEFFKTGVKGATELNATVAQSKATFGSSFGQVAEQAEKNSKAFHTSKGAQLELASAFGGMAQGAGIAENKSASLANELTQLAVDAGGVGISMGEIGDAMKTGLSGRAISLKQFAVNIDENTTKAYAWKTGIAKVGQELTTQQTLMARAGQVMRGLDYVRDSLTKGMGQAGVQFKMAGGGVSLFAEKIGEIMLPALKAGAIAFNELMGVVLDFASTHGSTIKEWAEAGAQGVQDLVKLIKVTGPEIVANITWAWGEAKKGPLGFAIEGIESVWRFVKAIPNAIGIAIRNAGILWEIGKLKAGAFVENVIRYVETIPANFGIILPWLKRNWSNLLTDLVKGFGAFAANLMDNAANFGVALWDAIQGKGFKFEFKPLLDGFKATTEKLPELIGPDLLNVDDEVNKLWEKIAKNERDRIKPKPGEEAAGGMKKPPILPEDKSKEYKLGGALEAGTKEAFSAISRGGTAGKQGSDQLGVAKNSLEVQRQQLAAQRETLGFMKGKNPFETKLAVK